MSPKINWGYQQPPTLLPLLWRFFIIRLSKKCLEKRCEWNITQWINEHLSTRIYKKYNNDLNMRGYKAHNTHWHTPIPPKSCLMTSVTFFISPTWKPVTYPDHIIYPLGYQPLTLTLPIGHLLMIIVLPTWRFSYPHMILHIPPYISISACNITLN